MNFSALMSLIRRFPLGAVCTLLTIILSISAWILRGQIVELDSVRREREKEGEAMLELLVGGSTQRQELAFVKEVAKRIDENIVVEDNLAENYGYFYKLEEQTKVRLDVHQSSPSPTGETSTTFERIPYALRVVGTFNQVAAFLLGLETGPRLVNITGFSCVRTGTGSVGLLSLDLSIELLGKK